MLFSLLKMLEGHTKPVLAADCCLHLNSKMSEFSIFTGFHVFWYVGEKKEAKGQQPKSA